MMDNLVYFCCDYFVKALLFQNVHAYFLCVGVVEGTVGRYVIINY